MPPKRYEGAGIVAALDEWFGKGDVPQNLAEARDLLQGPGGFGAIIAELNTRRRGRGEFVYPVPGSPLQGDEFEQVVREGYLAAIARALGRIPARKIKTAFEAGDGDTFTTRLEDQGQHVKLILVIPTSLIGAPHRGKYR